MTIYSRNNPPQGFYVYLYLREDGTPYYVGKGQKKRAWKLHPRGKYIQLLPLDFNRIQIIAHRLNESESHLLERKLIMKYGRKDLGTGILRNLTAGGEGSSGAILGPHSPATIEKIRNTKLGKKLGPQSAEHIARRIKPLSSDHVSKLNSPDAILKRSQKMIGVAQPKATCVHCGKAGGAYNMKRYHFDNCKHQHLYDDAQA